MLLADIFESSSHLLLFPGFQDVSRVVWLHLTGVNRRNELPVLNLGEHELSQFN